MNPSDSERVDTVASLTKKKKGYRLFKRVKADQPGYREAHWYFQFEYRGKRYPRCLETNDAEAAQKKARWLAAQIKLAVQSNDDRAIQSTKLRQRSFALLRDIFACYRKRAGIASVGSNITSLRCILRDVLHLEDDQIDSLSSNALTGKLLRDYQTLKVPVKTPRNDAERTAIISCNSTIRQARSLFKRELMTPLENNRSVYAEEGVHLPDLSGFLAVRQFKKVQQKFKPIPETLLQTILDKRPELKEKSPNAYRAFLLAECCGLRRAEAARLCWSHLQPVTLASGGIQYRILISDQKNGSDESAYMESSVYEELKSMTNVVALSSPEAGRVTPCAPSDFILTGPFTDRYRHAFDDLANWLKGLGWTRRKKAHEFRKLFGARMAEQFGTRVGAMLLRNDEKVFRQHYDTALTVPEVKLFSRG